jgi:cyclophilin family peptidyl-prolyl cis-trans isomerase/HEAT repeat protein
MAKYSSGPRRGAEPLRYDTRMARRRLGFSIVWLAVAAAAAAIGAGCKSVPTTPAETTPAKPPASLDTKIAWTLRLEQQRVLRDPDVTPPAPRPAGTPRANALRPAADPDLVALSLDPSAALRRRAVLAIGRVGLSEGMPALIDALTDSEPDVRAMAAFALGLAGRADTIATLEHALTDEVPVVRARAMDAIGLIADRCRADTSACGAPALAASEPATAAPAQAGGAASSQPSTQPASQAPATVDLSAAASAVAQAAAGCGPILAALAPDATDVSPEADACRAALFALARLGQYDALARVALDASGQPASTWWPVASALARVNDRRAAAALRALAATPTTDTRVFALGGLAAVKDAGTAGLARPIALDAAAALPLRAAAVRALGSVGGQDATAALLQLLSTPDLPVPLHLAVIAALGQTRSRSAFDPLLDWLTAPNPAVRAATMRSLAAIDPDAFLTVQASLGSDADWSVRAALASVLGGLSADRVTAAIEDLVTDADARVHGPALEALVAVHAPDATSRLFAALEAGDVAERATAAELVGRARPDGGAARLVAAYERGLADGTGDARDAVVSALAQYSHADAEPTWRKALADPAWSVRVHAARFLRDAGVSDAAPERPAPLRQPASFFSSDALLHPAYSPHAFVETSHGTIEIELNVVDAGVTSLNFIALARAGFFNGTRIHRVVPGVLVQGGDPRGDGTGRPGYALVDELSPRPFVRGTVGMALAGPDTGGSQWFVTLVPQPQLDAKYTVFGHVVRGWDVLDQVAPWDVIERVRIWDGVSFE